MKILIVDDVKAYRDAISDIVRSAGYKDIRSCGTPQEAFYVARVYRPDILIVDSDLGHRHTDGIELIESIKRHIRGHRPRSYLMSIMPVPEDEWKPYARGFFLKENAESAIPQMLERAEGMSV